MPRVRAPRRTTSPEANRRRKRIPLARWSGKYPLHRTDDRFRLEAGDDLGEVLEIPHLEFDQHLREVRGPTLHAHVVDVAVGLADQLSDLSERTRLIERGDSDFRRKPLGIVGIDIPRDVDPALLLEFLEFRRMDLENANSLSIRKHPDDAVPGHRPSLLEFHRK